MVTLLPFFGAGPCVVLSPGLCVCVLVSLRSAFAHRWRVAGKGSQPEMEAHFGEAAWGQGEGFHILFQIMMYWEASVGLGRQSPIGGCSVPRPVCASVIQGFANEWEALPGFKQSSARGGPRLAAGSPGFGFSSHSGFVHFWSVSWVWPLEYTGEIRKRQWIHFPGLAPRAGPLGIISKEHFPTPSPVSDMPAWVGYPSYRCPSPGSQGQGQCRPRSRRKVCVCVSVCVVSNAIITILF